MLTPAEEEVDVEVSKDDQQRINEFGRLNARKHEIKDEIDAAKKRLEDLSDAEEGIMLADETEPGAIKIMVGEAFVDVDSSKAMEYMEGLKKKEDDTIAGLEAELRGIVSRQTDLKGLLYGKFGKGINLED